MLRWRHQSLPEASAKAVFVTRRVSKGSSSLKRQRRNTRYQHGRILSTSIYPGGASGTPSPFIGPHRGPAHALRAARYGITCVLLSDSAARRVMSAPSAASFASRC